MSPSQTARSVPTQVHYFPLFSLFCWIPRATERGHNTPIFGRSFTAGGRCPSPPVVGWAASPGRRVDATRRVVRDAKKILTFGEMWTFWFWRTQRWTMKESSLTCALYDPTFELFGHWKDMKCSAEVKSTARFFWTWERITWHGKTQIFPRTSISKWAGYLRTVFSNEASL